MSLPLSSGILMMSTEFMKPFSRSTDVVMEKYLPHHFRFKTPLQFMAENCITYFPNRLNNRLFFFQAALYPHSSL